MTSLQELRDRLLRLDRRAYRAYRDIEGQYRSPQFTLFIDRAQSDPFAPPSRLRIRMPTTEACFPADLLTTPVRRLALADYLARTFRTKIDGERALHIDAGGQTILERTAATVTEGDIELALTARLPGAGRTILGRAAAALLTEIVPCAVLASLPYRALQPAAVRRHLEAAEDAEALRAALAPAGLVAFVADGAILPRRSGASDEPLRTGVIPFQSPPSLRVTLTAPHAGDLSGMGVPEGITLIVGGGFHGKTTLLQALEVGMFNHIPGDGRERVVTVAGGVKVRAEDGRRVEKVDISPFLNNLPVDIDTTRFSTDNASGSTSQAAAIMEALEIGTDLLLLDEDTSATNFIVRDELMQRLIPQEMEPITPLIDRVPELRTHGISMVLVMGGNGDYFAVADQVIAMERYRPTDVTERARDIVATRHHARVPEVPGPFHPPIPRVPLPASISPETPRGRTRVRVPDRDEIRFGGEEIVLGMVDQLVDTSQTRAIAYLLIALVAGGYIDGSHTVRDALDRLAVDIEDLGLRAVLGGNPPGDLARPRRQEIGAALNRLRTLEVYQKR